MIKKTIAYVDYDGNPREEDFYFNISKAELTDMYMSVNGGFDKLLNQLANAQDQREMMRHFKELIIRSYGEKDLDGRRFRKNQEITDNFLQTEAFSVLMMELMSNPKTAAEFVNSIMPSDLANDVRKNNPHLFEDKSIPQTIVTTV